MKRESPERDGGQALVVRLFQVIFLGSLAQPAPLPIPARVIGTDKLQKVLDITLAAAYMLLLSQEISQRNRLSLVTNINDAFQASEYIRFPQQENQSFFPYNLRARHLEDNVFLDACLNEMILRWFTIAPETDVKKIIAFKAKRADELLRLKQAISNTPTQVYSRDERSFRDIQESAANYVQNVVQPAYDGLTRLLEEDKFNYKLDTLEVSWGSFLSIALGGVWPVITAPVIATSAISITLKTIKFFTKRQRHLHDSSWSYLYRSKGKFQ